MAFSLVPNVGAPGRLQWSGVPQPGWIDADVISTSNIVPTYMHNASAVRYVSPTGNDSSGTGSSSQPYLTIARALTDVQAGGLIILDAGTYAMPLPFGCNADAQIWVVGDNTSGNVVIDGGGSTLVIGRRGSPSADGSRVNSPFRFRYITFTNLAGLSNYTVATSPGIHRRPVFMDCSLTFSSLGHQANMFNGAWVETVDFINCAITGARINTSINSGTGAPQSIAGGTFPANTPTVTNGTNQGFRFYNCLLTNTGFDGSGGWITSGNVLSGGVTRLWGCIVNNSAIPYTGRSLADLQGSKVSGATTAQSTGILFVWLSKVFMANTGYTLEYASNANNTQLNAVYFSGDNVSVGATLKSYRSLLFAISGSSDTHPLHPSRTSSSNTVANTSITNAANTIGYAGKGSLDNITGISYANQETAYYHNAQIGHPDHVKISAATRLQSASAVITDLPPDQWYLFPALVGNVQ